MSIVRFVSLSIALAVASVPVEVHAQSLDAGSGEGDAGASEASVAEPERPSGPTKVIIATKQAPPFAIKNDGGHWTGLSIELWERIAEELGYEFEVVETDIQGMTEGLADGRFDAAVAAMTVTADREHDFDFSHPFYTTGLGIAVTTDRSRGVVGAILGLFSIEFLRSLAALLGVLLVVGIVVWLFERRRNSDEFGGTPVEGIGSGFWWSAVTMTTVGYGDKAPKTFGGRIVGLVWMFVSVITVSGFTAAIASALTVSQLGSTVSGSSDLPRPEVQVGSVDLTTSAAYLRGRHIEFESFSTPGEGLEALARGEIDAMVYDAPIIRYIVNREYDGRLRVLGETFERQDYAVGLPSNSPLREDLNRELLRQTRSDWWSDTLRNYLGR